jgi:ribosomal protein L7Ae-like RNA K-turn-binding protein
MLELFKKRKKINERSLDEIKNICKILFIDDKSFPIIGMLEKNGWRNIQKISDVSGTDQQEVRDAHILFIDIQGVGKKMKLPDEGLGLTVAIKKKYPNKKVIVYSAEDQGQVRAFHEGFELADSQLSKNSNSYEFQFRLEKFAKEIFSLNEVIERIKKELIKELGIAPHTDEIIKKVEQLNSSKNINLENISKIFNLQNAANLAQIIQIFLFKG